MARTLSACEAGTHQAATPNAGSFVARPSGGASGSGNGDRQFAALRQLEAGDFNAFEADGVFARAQSQIVGHAHGGNDEPQFGGQLFANAADAAQQRRIRRLRQ